MSYLLTSNRIENHTLNKLSKILDKTKKGIFYLNLKLYLVKRVAKSVSLDKCKQDLYNV